MKEMIKKGLKNLCSNLLCVISAVMWYEVQYWKPEYYRRAVYSAVIAAVIVAVMSGNIFEKVRSASKGIWLLAGLTTLGAVIFPINYLKAPAWQSIASAWFVFSLLVICYKYLQKILGDIFADFGKKEYLILGAVTIIFCVFVAFSFSKSVAFYGTQYSGDSIYTSDSTQLVQKNVYLQLLHVENDLRQPLFAVVSIPFMGLAYLLSLILAPIPHASIICMGIAQMLLLLLTLLLLSKILQKGKEEGQRFFLLSCLMYPSILFSVMMEQYIVAVFWLVLYLYALIIKKEKSDAALIASAGSLLTSAAIVVFSEETEKFDWKKYVMRILEIAGKGVFAIVFFCRMDVISTIFAKIESLKKFSGESVPMTDRLLQYAAFVKSCFFAPEAGENWVNYNRMTWQLKEVESISWLGILLFVMAAAGFWIGKKQLLTKICGFWILHSLVILCVLGWGTIENGLILYALYYGWAFWILVYQFIAYWLSKCKPQIKYAVWAVLFLVTAVINGKGILELLIFARTYFPT